MNRLPRRLITGTTSSPRGTARLPPGINEFCTSAMIRTEDELGMYREFEPANVYLNLRTLDTADGTAFPQGIRGKCVTGDVEHHSTVVVSGPIPP